MKAEKVAMLEQVCEELYAEMINHSYSENEAIAMNIVQNAIAIVKEYIKWRENITAFSGIGYADEKADEIKCLLDGLRRNIEIGKGMRCGD